MQIELNQSLIGQISSNKSKRIADCTDAEIGQTLAKIFVMVGLRSKNMPSEIESKILFQKIREYYPQKKLDEIVLAFDLAIQKKIDADVIVYDQFTLPYLTEIMDKYRVYINELAKDTPVEIPKQIEYKMTKEEKLKDIEDFGKNPTAFNMIPGYIYDWIIELGLMIIDEDEKIEYYRRAIEMRESELKKNAEFGDVKEYGAFMKSKKNGFQDISKQEVLNIDFNFKRIVVREYYNNKL
jgi:hypothetical protein